MNLGFQSRHSARLPFGEMPPRRFRLGLKLALAVDGFYGLALLIFPVEYRFLVDGEPVPLVLLRLPGALLLAMAVGNYLAGRSEAPQGTWIAAAFLAHLLGGGVLLFALFFGEYAASTWSLVLPAVLFLFTAALLALGGNIGQGGR